MYILLIKLLLAPILITLVTWVGRRWGNTIGGLLAALPLTSAPVSVFLIIERGKLFAVQAATAMIAGVASVVGFCLIYAISAKKVNWLVSTFAGLCGYLAITLLLNSVSLPLIYTYLSVCSLLIMVCLIFPQGIKSRKLDKMPWWNLPARILVATSFIFLITNSAPFLGPNLSGLITPFPIFATVLGTFTHYQEGGEAAINLLRGIIFGLFGFISFFLVVGLMLNSFSIPFTYLAACLVAILLNSLILVFINKKRVAIDKNDQ